MMWSPPLSRTILQNWLFCTKNLSYKRYLSLLMAGVTVLAAPGCGTLSGVHRSVQLARHAAIESSAAQLPDLPNFDEPPAVARVATSRSISGIITAARPFAWEQNGKTAGGLKFQTYSAGHDGYRTVVIGSVGGNDPVAIRLIDDLATHLHQQDLILGGFETRIIRTLNPDGQNNGRFVNADGDYVNNHFPARQTPGLNRPAMLIPEVQFALTQLQDIQPQRVIHLRTIKSARGIIAASKEASSTGRELAEWLGFELKVLPGSAVDGSVERYIAMSENMQMITVAIPESTPVGEAWTAYGDAVLNLLLGDDFQTRELARKKSSSSASIRNRDPANP